MTLLLSLVFGPGPGTRRARMRQATHGDQARGAHTHRYFAAPEPARYDAERRDRLELLARAFELPIELSPLVEPRTALVEAMQDGQLEGIVLKDELMNREAVPHARAWTRESVKDIWRRGRFYLGFVVEKRGRDERPGRHEPILTDAEYRLTAAAVAARKRVGNKPKPFRHYVLRGLLHCECGTRMRGEAHLQRGTERRYYRCPKLGCRAKRSPADLVEEEVLDSIARGVLPDSVIDAARAELRKLLETSEVADAGRQRARLVNRLEQLKKQHAWGDLTDAEYLAKRDATRAHLGQLPDGDRIRTFDAYRARVLELPVAIEVASPAKREELCRIVVQNVVVQNGQLAAIEWTPAARPFFAKRQRECPQGDSGTRPLSFDDDLAWYVA